MRHGIIQQLTNYIKQTTSLRVSRRQHNHFAGAFVYTHLPLLLLQFIVLIRGDKTQPFRKITNHNAAQPHGAGKAKKQGLELIRHSASIRFVQTLMAKNIHKRYFKIDQPHLIFLFFFSGGVLPHECQRIFQIKSIIIWRRSDQRASLLGKLPIYSSS